MIPFKTYIQVAIWAIVCSGVCYVLKMNRFHGDVIIVMQPDITLHDIIYFNAENFVNLFDLVACCNLCYFISACYPKSSIAFHVKHIVFLFTALCTVRTIGHFFTYYHISGSEKVVDYLIVLIFVIRYLFYYFKPPIHYDINRHGLNS